MIETILLWLFVVVVGYCILASISIVLNRLKQKRARRLLKEIVQFYAASHVKGRITKEDFFQQARRLLFKSKYHRMSKSRADRYIEACTGFTPE